MIKLRRVREEDSRLLWEWANDQEVRSNSFSQKTITWEEHIQWLNEKLRDPNCLFFVALDKEERPIGQARFDLNASEAVREVFHSGLVQTVSAFIKPANMKSVNAFERAGFRKVGLKTVRGNLAVHYTLSSVSCP